MIRLALIILATAVQATSAAAREPVRLDRFQAEIDAFRAADMASPPPPCQTLFVGSSSIRLWTDLPQRFPFPVVQRGVGGSTLAEITHYFPVIVTPYHPKRIVLYAGENDLSEGRTVEQALVDLRQFMALKRKSLGATPVYLLSAKPSPSRVADLQKQRAFNARAAAFAARDNDLAFIDVATPMMRGGAVRPEIFRDDRLHMTNAGYDIWTRIITVALARPPESRAPGC